MPKQSEQIVLTGDRPTGPLHLGHYSGSLQQRVRLQQAYRQFVLIADLQALTDNVEHFCRVRENVIEVALDYLAVGIEPSQSSICLQTAIPELAELTTLLMNFVTSERVQRNPTVKTEIRDRNYGRNASAGFVMYPVSQVADITGFRASLIPVGADQLPMIELTNEIVERFNTVVGSQVLLPCEAILPRKGARLSGLDGASKMSKSLGNAIYLRDSADVVAGKVRSMFTDPSHLRIEDPGKVDGNVVFEYLETFAPDDQEIEDLKDRYRQGGLGDAAVKSRLLEILLAVLDPIRQRRQVFEQDLGYVHNVISHGTVAARQVASRTLSDVRSALKLIDTQLLSGY